MRSEVEIVVFHMGEVRGGTLLLYWSSVNRNWSIVVRATDGKRRAYLSITSGELSMVTFFRGSGMWMEVSTEFV